MDYDVIIIGAGMSGLAAGVRLAMFDKRVCIVERHDMYGGLNSCYSLGGRHFDVGLHALTNFVKPGVKNTPLPKILRQLRIPRDALDLCEQTYSQVSFPHRRLRFSNDVELLSSDVAAEFADQADGFQRLLGELKTYEELGGPVPRLSTRRVLSEYFTDQSLIEMLLCPVMYYGSAEQNDMDFAQFTIMFRSLFLEGFSRPLRGVRRVIAEVVKRYRGCGGELRMKCGVQRMICDGRRAAEIVLDNDEVLSAEVIISSAGLHETMRLCSDHVAGPQDNAIGQVSFVESISVLPHKPADLGIDATIIFFNDAETFTYARPDELIDPRSGVICMPNNYERHEHLSEGVVRLTSMANFDLWSTLEPDEYARQKEVCYDLAADRAVKFIPEFRDHIVFRDIFTPRTIKHFTGHLNGAVYGSPDKVRDGRTRLENVFICGTDQGFVGIIGAMMSGIGIANQHVLSRD